MASRLLNAELAEDGARSPRARMAGASRGRDGTCSAGLDSTPGGPSSERPSGRLASHEGRVHAACRRLTDDGSADEDRGAAIHATVGAKETVGRRDPADHGSLGG